MVGVLDGQIEVFDDGGTHADVEVDAFPGETFAGRVSRVAPVFDPATRRAMLNGKPYFMRGSNFTLYRFFEDSERGTLPWDDAWVRRLHRKFKTMHWNSLRYCIGFPPERWYAIADEEGFAAPAAMFRAVAAVEVEHDKRYQRLLAHIKSGTLYKREKPVRWKCTKCGRVHEGTEAPEKCPTCAHPQGWFVAVEANY